MLELIITNRYRLIEKLNIGAFYDVFRAIHIHNDTTVAIKIEQKSLGQSKLFTEAKILKELQGQSLISDLGFPTVVETGSQGTYNYLVMELFGTSVDKIVADNGGKLQLKLALQLGQQMIQGLQMLHEKGYVHRDLRPEHFLHGRVKRPSKLFITGFCMAKKYLRIDNKHADYKDTKQSFTGVPRYLSINAHMGIQQSRRDDIESLIYILVYLVRGNLPWQKQKAKGRRDKYQKILDVKLTASIETVCQNVPEVFRELLLYARLLQYEETPDYQYLKKTLRGINDPNFIY